MMTLYKAAIWQKQCIFKLLITSLYFTFILLSYSINVAIVYIP